MTDDSQDELPGFSAIGNLMATVKAPSRIKRRLIDSSAAIQADDPDSVLYQHTVFCQTAMPYRDPGDEVREWEREQGRASLLIEAGRAKDPETGRWLKLGLPYGPKPRLILAYLNATALRTGSPEIEVEDSLTAFVKRIGLHAHGRDLRVVKDQLARLSAATIRLAITAEERSVNVNAHIVSAFDLWFPKDDRQRVLWPTTINLSLDYFDSLTRHAVPLDERALAALSHNAMALDAYAWLAQRLHRVPPSKAQFVPWSAVKDQFGWHYHRMVEFRRVFKGVLSTVHSQYQGARFDIDDRGLTLRHSPPPVKARVAAISSVWQAAGEGRGV
jgi:hypothetical protein